MNLPMKNHRLHKIYRRAVTGLLSLPLAAGLVYAAEPSGPPLDADGNFSGRVVETTNAAGYSYVLVDTGGHHWWAATTEMPLAKGDQVKVYGGMAMAQFHSPALNRDFDVIYFSGKIGVETADGHPAVPPPGHSGVLPPDHPPLTDQGKLAAINLKGIPKARGGQTVRDIFAAGAKLANHEVTVRARVVKYNGGIMGKNWLHLRDGTGTAEEKNNDLTVTSDNVAQVGDLVLVTGRVSLDKDFGAGYKYSMILDGAKVKVEKSAAN